MRSFDFSQIDGHKISTNKSTIFSKLEVRIITDAPRNVDACIVDGMFLVQSHVVCLQPLVVKQMRLCLVISDVQIVYIKHVALLNIHQLMILPEIMVSYGER